MNVHAQPLRDWSTQELVDHLRGRGLPITGAPHAVTLAGGVSGTVIRLDDDQTSVVIKQALAELAVDLPWHADPRRVLTEAHALTVLHHLTPEHVPEVIDCDEDRLLLVMESAPADWANWKTRLLGGAPSAADDMLAHDFGRTLRHWHDATREDTWNPALGERTRFATGTDFADLRIDPFYRYVAAELGGPVADALTDLADGLAASSECLVHGDVSPKNVLVSEDSSQWWLLDAECAVLGDPAFDVAFVTAHLLLKSLDPARARLVRTAESLWAGYLGQTPPLSAQHLAAHSAAILLARVAGISRVDYLTPRQSQQVREGATAALLDPPHTLAELAAALHDNEGGAL